MTIINARRQLAREAALGLLLLASFGVALSHQQSSISLNNAQWFVSNANGSLVAPAQVPGGIYSDLRRAQVLKQDLLMGKNDIAYRWVGNENWTYTTSFSIDQQIAMSQSVKLVMHGVDTVATVYLNGEEIGQTDNMFVRYKFDVKPHLKLAGLKNILVVRFESPVKYALRKFQQSLRQNRGKILPPYCTAPVQRGECHVNFIRKMQASFSWDWGPAFPSMGIYKNIELEFGSFGVIRDLLVETKRSEPLVPSPPSHRPMVPAQVIISSNIKHNVRTPTVNKSVPYVRAPPYYVPIKRDDDDPFQHRNSALGADAGQFVEAPLGLELLTESQGLMEENWLLKVTLVAEMVQPSFGYNVRIEFNLNGVLHYESEHINVVANDDGFIRLGFNLRIDPSRMRVKPWWPNNAGSQTLYKLSARMLPIPSPQEQTLRMNSAAGSALGLEQDVGTTSHLQARAKPLQTPAVPPMTFLASSPDLNSHLIQQVSEKEIRFGFRTVELMQEPITRGNLDDGLTFNFRINGIDLFAMGSNWIPASVLPENHNDLEHIRYLLQSAKDANMNMLRVWGGGLYETDEFYQMADEMGIMIWHDFMFACALYPVDDDYIESVRLEIQQQVQRLQHHPSIVLWAGNNENEMAIAGPWWSEVYVWSKTLRQGYNKLYRETIKPIVQVLDPSRPYAVSSPSNGIISEKEPDSISKKPNDNKYGDVHHYEYYTDSFDWTVYPSTRFASEYGFQSYPSFNALSSFTNPADWKYPLNSNILHRQHRLTGETEIKLQLRLHFNELKSGGPDKLKTFIYLSQLSQAIAIKTETEFYRRNRFIDAETKLGRTMGALYWQLNDVWQAPTWSSIEFGGKWKMLHYFARRFFFPIQVMPYIVQPPNSATGAGAGLSQQRANSRPLSQQQSFAQPVDMYANSSSWQQQQSHRQEQGPGPLFAVDLVRDDLFDLLDSFNFTIRFFRWTHFAPVWQDTVYVRNTRPQNVTRIYEQEVSRIVRQPGVISLSSGVFQVVIEQQPRLGLSQIENYLMPVAPNRVTAMRVAKINVELVQGPFELTDLEAKRAPAADDSSAAAQWACAYRLTLVSDSIAMFVWLDLNFQNAAGPTLNSLGGGGGSAGEGAPGDSQSAAFASQTDRRAPDNIQLNALPQQQTAALAHLLPEHIRLHANNREEQENGAQPAGNINRAPPPPPSAQDEALASEPIISFSGDGTAAASGDLMGEPAAASGGVSAKGDSLEATAAKSGGERAEVGVGLQQQQQQRRWQRQASEKHRFETQTGRAAVRRKRQTPEPAQANQALDRLILNINRNNNNKNNNNGPHSEHYGESGSPNAANGNNHNHHKQHRPLKPAASAGQARYRPVDASGGQLLRYQFSDNAFNMFEPSKVIDLYLSRCLSRAQIEVALEIQSLADCL